MIVRAILVWCLSCSLAAVEFAACVYLLGLPTDHPVFPRFALATVVLIGTVFSPLLYDVIGPLWARKE